MVTFFAVFPSNNLAFKVTWDQRPCHIINNASVRAMMGIFRNGLGIESALVAKAARQLRHKGVKCNGSAFAVALGQEIRQLFKCGADVDV